MTNGKLVPILSQLRTQAQAQSGKPARFNLSGGLRLAVVYNLTRSPRWQVSLIREGVVPSPKEVEVIRRDFGIPGHARKEINKQRLGQADYHIVRLKWDENGKQLSFLDEGDQMVVTAAPESVNNYQIED